MTVVGSERVTYRNVDIKYPRVPIHIVVLYENGGNVEKRCSGSGRTPIFGMCPACDWYVRDDELVNPDG